MRVWNSISFAALMAVSLTLSGCGSSGEPATSDASGTTVPGDSGGNSSDAKTAKVETPKKETGDPLHPVIVIKSSQGEITLKLDAESAPGTVSNFLNYVNASYYDATIFHYVDGESMILGGGYTEDLQPKAASAAIRNEAHNGKSNKRGTIAMSRQFDSIDSATCQFFINLKDNPDLDHREDTPEDYGYCVFGEVIKGIEVVEAISKTATHDQGDLISTPKEQVVIKAIRQLR